MALLGVSLCSGAIKLMQGNLYWDNMTKNHIHVNAILYTGIAPFGTKMASCNFIGHTLPINGSEDR